MDCSYVVSLVAAIEVVMSSMAVGALGSEDSPSGPASGIEDMIAQMNRDKRQVRVTSRQVSITSYL
jgi:hypothetical protein